MLPATPASASHLGAREPPRIHHMHVPGCRLPSPAMQSARRTRSLKTGFRMRVEDPPRHRARPQNACCGAYRTGYWVSTATPGRADAGRDVACQAGARSSPQVLRDVVASVLRDVVASVNLLSSRTATAKVNGGNNVPSYGGNNVPLYRWKSSDRVTDARPEHRPVHAP